MKNKKIFFFRFAFLLFILSGNCQTNNPISLTRDAYTYSEYYLEMRDHIQLFTRVILPANNYIKQYPTILLRTPYNTRNYLGFVNTIIPRGYALVLQDCRGQYNSGGTMYPYSQQEIFDAQDCSKWIINQSWSDGSIGTLGASYDGFTALAAAVQNPYIKVVVADDPAKSFSYEYKNGVLDTDILGWLNIIENEEYNRLSTHQHKQISNSLDLNDLDLEYLGHRSQVYQDMINLETLEDNLYWEKNSLDPYFDEIAAPVLIVYSGDAYWDHPLEIFNGLNSHSKDTAQILLTPEHHGFHFQNLLAGRQTSVNTYMMDYFDACLKNNTPVNDSPVLYYFAGENYFQSAPGWPIKNAEVCLYLAADNRLTQETGIRTDKYTVAISPQSMDPYKKGKNGYSELVFQSAVFDNTTFLAGVPQLILYISTEINDFDLFVMMFEKSTKEENFIQSGFLRARYYNGTDKTESLTPGEIYCLKPEFYPKLYKINPGSVLKIVITNGMPRFFENPLTGEPLTSQTRQDSGEFTLHVGEEYPSRIVLSVLE